MTWKALFGHLKTITRHHHMVMLGCFKVGLYRQGLLHDLSKLSPAEFIPGVKYYQGGKRSPTGAERRATGISKAWLHHKAHNKHHLEYWLDWTKEKPAVLHGMPIPPRYLAEMAVDRMSAAIEYVHHRNRQLVCIYSAKESVKRDAQRCCSGSCCRY